MRNLFGLAFCACATVCACAALCWSAPASAEDGFEHGEWPLKPLARPSVPTFDDVLAGATPTVTGESALALAAARSIDLAAWGKNPIDSFVLAKLLKAGLLPSKPADKLTLLRRVTFDLIGLPPTPSEQRAFVEDDTPDAYQKVVERLLSSPRYGERWSQHWLDVVRYAETAGFKKDDLRADAYKYRDYVIQALNKDLPYDKFIAQQLAGDEISPDDPEALVATGFNRLYPEETNASNFVQARQMILDDVTEVTGLAFMGLTIGCAKCHDHKFDPISQTDYYRLQAVFASILPHDDLQAVTAEERKRYEDKYDHWEEATADIRRQLDEFLAPERKEAVESAVEACDPATQQAVETPPEKRTPLQMQLAELADDMVQRKLAKIEDQFDEAQKTRYSDLTHQLAAFDYLRPAKLPTAMAVTDTGVLAPPTFCLAAGNYDKPLQEVTPGFPSCVGLSEPTLSPPPAAPHSTGRRLALANWLTRPDHPLTARVMVNRIWQNHFGVGIVGSANDFGAMGDAPTHQDMLDWLASEFVSQGWSLKAVHRLIVCSNTYRQSSQVDPADAVHVKAQKVDGADKLLWHFRRRRLEGEAIRDASLQISGELNWRMYGPSARPELPASMMTSRYSWDPDPAPEDRNRRSVYIFARRNMRYPLLAAFDPPDMHNSCARRTATTTAPQALVLLNSEFMLEQARHWSGDLLSRYPHSDPEVIDGAYVEAYARHPTTEELSAATAFLETQAERITAGAEISPNLLPEPAATKLPAAKAAAMVDFCHALLNSTEFLDLD